MQNIGQLEQYICDNIGDDFLEDYIEEKNNLPAYEYADIIWNAFESKFPKLAAEYNNEIESDGLYSKKEIMEILTDQLNDSTLFAKVFKDICFNFDTYSIAANSVHYDYIDMFLNMFKEGNTAEEIINELEENPSGNTSGYNNKMLYNFINFIVRKLYFQYARKNNIVKNYEQKYYFC